MSAQNTLAAAWRCLSYKIEHLSTDLHMCQQVVVCVRRARSWSQGRCSGLTSAAPRRCGGLTCGGLNVVRSYSICAVVWLLRGDSA